MALPISFVDKDRYTEDDYFAFEETSVGRWEYVDGEIRAMSGGSDDHTTIVGNIGSAFHGVLAGKGCRVYFSDMRVHTGSGINTFPDITIVCGPRKYHRGRTDTITNLALIVEVLSPSTQGYDRGEKFDHYKTIPSLCDYLVVFPDSPKLQLHTRAADHWTVRDIVGLDSKVFVTSLETAIAMADIYAQIEFTESN